MKKVFGVLFLLLGLGMIVLGIAAITNVETRRSSAEGYIGEELNSRYRNENNEQQLTGVGLSVGGLLFFVIGIVMLATKSSSQKRKEAELDSIKKWSENNAKQKSKNNSGEFSLDNLTRQAINLYNQKDYYAALAVLQRALAIDQANYQTHYNMACIYSLVHDEEAFNSLSKAVEFGYLNFEKIKTHPDLEWLRKHSEFGEFVKNGYKLKAKTAASNSPASPKDILSDDIYSQLEKLGKLKEKGLINDEEFQHQKKKILG